MSKISELQKHWVDTEAYHKHTHESFMERVNATPLLKAHRDWVEKNIHGFGERSFHWMWKLIIDDILADGDDTGHFSLDRISFLEIGVFRGQVLSLIKLLVEGRCDLVERLGITPLSSAGCDWESNYAADICRIHDEFKLDKDYTILKGLSTEPHIIRAAKATAEVLDGFHIVYIDGGHDYETVVSDLKHYAPLVNPGGILVVDDCATRFHMPFGYFQGIEPVSRAVDEVLPPATANPGWEFLFNVVHNRVWRKKPCS